MVYTGCSFSELQFRNYFKAICWSNCRDYLIGFPSLSDYYYYMQNVPNLISLLSGITITTCLMPQILETIVYIIGPVFEFLLFHAGEYMYFLYITSSGLQGKFSMQIDNQLVDIYQNTCGILIRISLKLKINLG